MYVLLVANDNQGGKQIKMYVNTFPVILRTQDVFPSGFLKQDSQVQLLPSS